MTFEIDNEKIGGYIANLIKQYYSSDRDFCRQYLKRRNIIDDGMYNFCINKLLNKIEIEKQKQGQEYINDLNNYKLLT